MKKFIITALKFACISSFLALTVAGLYFILHFLLKSELNKLAEGWFYGFSGAFWITAIALHLVSYQKQDSPRASVYS